jgi:hypothetical protein
VRTHEDERVYRRKLRGRRLGPLAELWRCRDPQDPVTLRPVVALRREPCACPARTFTTVTTVTTGHGRRGSTVRSGSRGHGPEPWPLPDSAARERATTATGVSLLVEASAGTGKTKTLIDRLLHLALEDGIPLSEIAALTFTE